MLDRKMIAALGGWEGYRVQRIVWPSDGSRTVTIHLVPTARRMHCEQCGSRCRQVHETSLRRVRELPLMALQVTLVVPRRRVWCEQCGGPRLEKLSWLGRYQRVTNRLAEAVNQLLASSNILATARFFGLGWHTVKALDKAWLRQSVVAPDWSRIHYLAMDEFALHKGHRYATVVVDPISRQVLWVGNGRSRETARTFFEQLPAGVAGQIRAVAIDMTTAYELEIKAHCPNAEVVYDLFHVVAKYGREVIDRVRVDEANRLRDDKPARRVVKTSRWLLLRNRENVPARQAVQLDELLAANRALLTVYLLKDDLKQLWHYRSEALARKAWLSWKRRATRSGLQPLRHFARCLEPYLPGILAHCRWALGTNLVEGINNKIKVIKRMAYGFRDDAYFFLKIRAAFPGVGR